MNVVIPKDLQAQVRKRAQKQGITEQTYIKTALIHAIKVEDELAEEMSPWNEAYLQDFAALVKKYNA